MRHVCEMDGLHEALALYQGPTGPDNDRGALRELLRDARRHGLPVAELAAEVEQERREVSGEPGARARR